MSSPLGCPAQRQLGSKPKPGASNGVKFGAQIWAKLYQNLSVTSLDATSLSLVKVKGNEHKDRDLGLLVADLTSKDQDPRNKPFLPVGCWKYRWHRIISAPALQPASEAIAKSATALRQFNQSANNVVCTPDQSIWEVHVIAFRYQGLSYGQACRQYAMSDRPSRAYMILIGRAYLRQIM